MKGFISLAINHGFKTLLSILVAMYISMLVLSTYLFISLCMISIIMILQFITYWCVYKFLYACFCVCTVHACVYMWQRSTSDSSSVALHLTFWDGLSFRSWGSLIQLDWLASKPWRIFLVLRFQCWDCMHTSLPLGFLHEMWGIRHRSLCGKPTTKPFISSSHYVKNIIFLRCNSEKSLLSLSRVPTFLFSSIWPIQSLLINFR